jgi:hypothetical protein
MSGLALKIINGLPREAARARLQLATTAAEPLPGAPWTWPLLSAA